MTDLFEYVNSITHNKKDLMRGTENDELAQKEYVPFMTNRSLSYHVDTIEYANEMNSRPHLDNLLQFDYYINKIRPKKRYAKWAKKTKATADLENVMEYFGFGRSKALIAIRTLSSDQLKEIGKKIEKGGRK